MLVQSSKECTPPYLSTGISNLLQPAQAEVVLGQLSMYLASWDLTGPAALWGGGGGHRSDLIVTPYSQPGGGFTSKKRLLPALAADFKRRANLFLHQS
jgi:hypothetical protein